MELDKANMSTNTEKEKPLFERAFVYLFPSVTKKIHQR